MTPNEFYERLSEQLEVIEAGKTTLILSPGPFKLRVGRCDAEAAKLLLWLQEGLPDGTTLGELEEVLLAALWWTQFWASLSTEANDADPGKKEGPR